MSKIEDALKKAYESGIVKYPGISVGDDMPDAQGKRMSSRELVAISRSDDGIRKKKASIEQISLMKNKKLLDAHELAEMKVINTEMHDEQIANSYRALRTKLVEESRGRNAVFLITSCGSDETSSLAAINIATAFAFDESKTSLLIDCNFNKPQVDKMLNVDSEHGLIDYLENPDVTEEEIIHETGIKRLRMIPAGKVREVSTEYLTSLKMRTLMSDISRRYPDRNIFINASPVDESADTRILVEMSDYVLMVVPYGMATAHKINESISEIDPKKFAGVIFVEQPTVPKLSSLFKFNKNK